MTLDGCLLADYAEYDAGRHPAIEGVVPVEPLPCPSRLR